MSDYLDSLEVQEKEGRTTDRQMVRVYKPGDAEYDAFVAQCKEGRYNVVVAAKRAKSEIDFRLTVLNSVRFIAKTAPSTKAKTKDQVFDRYELIGRDMVTNQTMYTWIIVADGADAPAVQTLMDFPTFLLKEGDVSYANKKFTLALKDTHQSAEQAMAEELNAARQAGYQATATSETAKETAAKATV